MDRHGLVKLPPVLTGHPVDLSEILDSPFGLYLAFGYTDPHDAEPLRLRHCQACQESAARGDHEDQRLRDCIARDCHLRDPARMAAEQRWCGETMVRLSSAALVADKDLANFNSHLARCGGLTPGFARTSSGRYTLAIHTTTLHGEIHRALIECLLDFTGEIRVNVKDQDTKAIQEEIAEQRRHWRRSRRRWQHQIAPALRAEGLSDNAIAKRLGVTPKAIRDWLGPREAWDREREGEQEGGSLTHNSHGILAS